MDVKSEESYAMFGQLEGIKCEDFAYVKQASCSVTIESQYTAHLCYHKNRQKHSNTMFLAFSTFTPELSCNSYVRVQFNLKESYFQNLLSSVEKLKIVSRLVPGSCTPIQQEDLEDTNIDSICSEYCSDEQLEALKIMVTSAPNNPPILLTGAIGTGKTRLLAICALYLLSKATESSPVRILVCTQQRLSADYFLNCYNKILWENKNKNVFVVRGYGYNSVDADSRKYYRTSDQFKCIYKQRLSTTKSLLVITTCLTAPRLKFLPEEYFSHVFIDEGSHMREPEAVAPLYFASANTKIIVSGEVNKVSVN